MCSCRYTSVPSTGTTRPSSSRSPMRWSGGPARGSWARCCGSTGPRLRWRSSVVVTPACRGSPRPPSAAAAAGFEPLVRATGGRAVAYTGNAIVVDHVAHEPDAMGAHDRRFERFGTAVRGGLRAARGGCPRGRRPGRVLPRGPQRQRPRNREARGHRPAGHQERVAVQLPRRRRGRGPTSTGARAGLRAPGLPFDEASVGSLTGEAPALGVEAVERALLEAYGADASLADAPDPDTLALAHDLVDQHRVSGLRRSPCRLSGRVTRRARRDRATPGSAGRRR